MLRGKRLFCTNLVSGAENQKKYAQNPCSLNKETKWNGEALRLYIWCFVAQSWQSGCNTKADSWRTRPRDREQAHYWEVTDLWCVAVIFAQSYQQTVLRIDKNDLARWLFEFRVFPLRQRCRRPVDFTKRQVVAHGTSFIAYHPSTKGLHFNSVIVHDNLYWRLHPQKRTRIAPAICFK